MPRYEVTIKQVLEYTFEIEADDEQEALLDAEEYDYERWGVEPEILSEETSVKEIFEED